MAKKKRSNSNHRKKTNVNKPDVSVEAMQNASQKKAFAPIEKEKPLLMRIFVVAICAVMVLGIVVGAVLAV